jgi:hypothetical protein
LTPSRHSNRSCVPSRTSNSGKLFVAGVPRLSIHTYDASMIVVPSLAVVVAGVKASRSVLSS